MGARLLDIAVDSLLVALFPPRCAACAEPLVARPRAGLCPPCLETLEPNVGRRCRVCDQPGPEHCAACAGEPPAFTGLRAPFVYGGAVADLIIASKFSGREDHATALGELLADDDEARRLSEGCAGLVPVPLSAARLRVRGYNQSALIAAVLKRRWGLPIVHGLGRERSTAAQSDLPAAARAANVQHAFVATPRGKRPGPWLLVDDVVTSGHTVRQAAAALIQSGAREVRVVSVARAALADV